METFGKAFADHYWVEVIEADQENFLDPDAKVIQTMGSLKQIVADRKLLLMLLRKVRWLRSMVRSKNLEDEFHGRSWAREERDVQLLRQ